MPDACSEPIPGVYARHPVGPSRNRGAPAQHRHHHPLIHAVAAGPDSFEPGDGRQVAHRIGQGHQLPMDQIPVVGRAAEARRADLLLSARVDQWIGASPGQDQSLWRFEGRKTGVEMVEPAPDHDRFDAARLGAGALMVPVRDPPRWFARTRESSHVDRLRSPSFGCPRLASISSRPCPGTPSLWPASFSQTLRAFVVIRTESGGQSAPRGSS